MGSERFCRRRHITLMNGLYNRAVFFKRILIAPNGCK